MIVEYLALPWPLSAGARNYIEYHIPPGDFLRAVIANDLERAVQLADRQNAARLAEIARWVSANVPPEGRGSWDAVNRWEDQCPTALKRQSAANYLERLQYDD